ncbi:MAG: NIPSNAP family protein [Alphaproteobacteria bacterium]|nr:NIPSNAP family protein [Alphaproteobacteria bacterium]
MILDERSYTLKPGMLPKYLTLYESRGWPVQTKHLGEPVGWFYTEVGTLNQVVHIWKYADMADREARRKAMTADPDWQAFVAEAAAMLDKMENRILVPAPFSPLR